MPLKIMTYISNKHVKKSKWKTGNFVINQEIASKQLGCASVIEEMKAAVTNEHMGGS